MPQPRTPIAPAPKQPKIKPQKPQNRSGGTAGGQFNQLHPRGRGGEWITKPGDGYGAAGQNPTTAQLQQRLNQLGYKVPVDGKYGPATAAAVQQFQKKYGLSGKFGVDAATQTFLQNPPDQSIAQIQKAKGATAKGTKGKGSTKITPAQKQQQKTVAADTKGAIAQGKIASAETRQAGHDTNVADAKHDAAQAQTAANRAEKLAKEAKAAAVGGTAQAKRSAISAQHTAAQAEKNAKSAAKAVKALKLQIAKQKAARLKRAQGPLAGEVAVLATGTVHVHHGGGGGTMKLTPPTKGGATPQRTGKVQVATSAEQPIEQPNLEENEMPKPDVEEGTWTGGNGVDNTSTVAFGYGGDESMSIKDGRDITPEADKPVWTRTGIDTSKADTTIHDGREAAPPPPTGDLTIQDGRSTTDVLKLLLNEAVEARKAAKTGDEFTRAFARERALRAKLTVAEGLWDPGKHPRGRGGKWMEVMNKLLGQPSRLHVRHLEDMGDDYLNARLHPDSDATESERKAIRAVQARRAAKLGNLTAGLRTGATFEGSIRAPRTMTADERRGGVPGNERPLSQVQRPLSQVQKPLSKIQKPLH